MKTIRQRTKELYIESWKLREASFEVGKSKRSRDKNFKRSREIQKQQNEVWKKKCFFENYLKEMEKRKDD